MGLERLLGLPQGSPSGLSGSLREGCSILFTQAPQPTRQKTAADSSQIQTESGFLHPFSKFLGKAF